jgi:hypothetical protein
VGKLRLALRFFGTLTAISLTLFAYTVTATTYYVSSSKGNDSNPGTSKELPWSSLTRVNNFYKLNPGDSILFKKGDNWNGTLRVNASGTKENQIYYGSYGNGDKPVIYGSEEILEWIQYSNNIYKASYKKSINQLFIDGKRSKAARSPNKGYYLINSVQNSTQFFCSDLDNNIDYSGAKWIGRTNPWVFQTKNIVASNNKTLRMNSVPEENLDVKEGFFLCNKIEFLDSPGEWYKDDLTNTVYLWTNKGDSPSNYVIRGSVNDYGFILTEKKYITISGLDFQHSANIAINVIDCENIIIDNNHILSPDGRGINFGGKNSTCTISNNIIEGANHHGIKIYSSNSILTNNQIYNTAIFDNLGLTGMGVETLAGRAIDIEGDDNIISYNRIVNSGYIGIGFTKRNIVEYNVIKDVCLVKDDGGGIYTYGGNNVNTTNSNSIIRNNIIDGVYGTKIGSSQLEPFGFGIYTDNLSTDIIIENNTIANCSYAGIFLHENKNMTVSGNTIINAGKLIHSSLDRGINSIHDNIFYALGSKQYDNSIQILVAERLTNFSHRYDRNTYVNHYNNNDIFLKTKEWAEPSIDSYNFVEWKRETGQDANSTIDISPLPKGHSEKLLYNDTKQTKTYNVGNSIFTDVFGKKITGTFKLEPFTSIILIGKDFDKINQSPSILDQTFHFDSPKNSNDSIGTLLAFDPDTAQTLYFSIVSGNDNGWLAIDSLNGKLFAKKDIQSPKDLTLEIMVAVTDSTLNFLSDSAKVTINVTGYDLTPPVITSFAVPPIYISLTVPIDSFAATDDVAVFGYIITETSQKPSAKNIYWSSTPPTTFKLPKEDISVLYAWAKDSIGNISLSKTDTVKVILPDMSPTFSEYLFEESERTIIIDTQGANDGIVKNELSWEEGIIGNGMKFSGLGYIDLGHSFSTNVESELSLSTWIKPDKGISGNQGIIVHGGTKGNSFALFLDADKKAIIFQTSGTTNTLATVDNVANLWDGNWHHILVTFNGFDKTIYLDNTIVKRIEATGKIESGWGFNLLIGAGSDNNTTTPFFQGLLDETRIFNYALNNDEIRELFDSVNKVYKTIKTTEIVTICEGGNYFDWTEPGQYKRILKRKLATDSGADSIVTTNLSVNQNYLLTKETTICEGETITLGQQVLTEPGEYTEIFNAINGCDSTVVISLTVIPKHRTKIVVNICEGEIFTFGTQTLTTTGEYFETYKSSKGCDSIATLHLNVNPTYNVTEDIIISNIDNYHGWTENGTYQRYLKSITGCDSIVTTNLIVEQAITQKIALEKGWNIFSSYLIPDHPNMMSVLEKLRNDGQLVRVLDENNNVYDESGSQIGWTNNIGKIQKTEGYKIKVQASCELEITGFKIDLPLDIPLHDGSNLISFPTDRTIDAMQAIEPLIVSGILLKVQDEKGHAIENWANIGWVNGIGDFQAGEGYIVKVNGGAILSINDISAKSTQSIFEFIKPEHFQVNYIGNGFDHMNINVMDLTESMLQSGDEIAIFDKGICVGAIKLNEQHFISNRVSIPASASEDQFNNGFSDGNPIEFKVWSKKTNLETKLLPVVIKGNLIYKKQASVFIKFYEEVNFSENIDIYPNPANGLVNLRFLSLPEAGAFIQFFDVTGKQVFNTTVQSNIEKIDIQNLPTGVYFVRTTINDQIKTNKLIVI